MEEKNILAEQLQAETELCMESEEAVKRLTQKKQEMEELIADFEVRFQEEEEKVFKAAEDKKKLEQGIRDLEDKLVILSNRTNEKNCSSPNNP